MPSDLSRQGRNESLRLRFASYLLVRKYGITLEEKQRMYDEQNGHCKICENPLADAIAANLDHDHETGRIRGLLCGSCNMFIGALERRWNLLPKILEYLGI